MKTGKIEQLPVSAFVITWNEESNIRRCLESVCWAKEIVVVDSFSSDRTVEVARGFTDKVYHHQWQGMVQQKGYALSKTTQPWAMMIDADEEVSPELAASIRRAIIEDDTEIDGFLVARRTSYVGNWIYHGGWYPDRKLRLFRRDRGRIAGRNPHDRVVVNGKTRRLSGDLLHYNYPSISNQLETIDRFSTIVTQETRMAWRDVRLAEMIAKPIAKFFTCYFIKQGYLDGVRGLIIAVASSFYVFLKYAKLWERDLRAGRE
ncbi:MAG: glycosyltransferase family 2 protein [Planctomycetota bacterium]